ncbi:conserved hypothetical protein [Neospora caninum Liverpool]|nr:conserved hypothetical protein [Neospora caninum Liverpool]CBZ51852.1 conserved hypothetical protein [Neospora caninum Liverpool]|eukprot:XP_003881885.1 conserved hypothetical protein [Neospora caninum Liverpool]
MRSPSSTARSESVASAQTAHETLGGSGEPGADREVGQSRATPFFSPDLPVSERTTPADSAGRKPATGSQAVKPLGTDGKALSTGHRVLQDSSGQVGEDGIPGRAVPDTPRSGDMQTNTVDAWTVGRGSTERSNLVTESQRETLAGSPVGPLPSGRESSATSPVTNDSTEEVATVYMQAGRSTDRSTVPDVDSSLVPDEEVKKEANTPMPQHPRILPLKVKGAPLLTDKTEAAAKLPQKRSEEVPSGGAPLGAGAAVAAGAAAVFAGSPGFAYAFPGPLASEDGKVAEMIFFSGKQFEQEHRTTDLVGKRQAGYRSQPSAAMWVGPFERKAPEKPEEHPLSQEAGVDIIEAGSMEGLPMKHPIDATYGVEGTETGNVEWTPMKKREHKTPSASYVPATGRAFLHASEMGVTGAGQKGDPDGILAHLANGEDARGVEKSIGHSGRLPFDAIDVYPALMQDAPPRRSGFFGAQQGIDRSTPPPNFPDGVWGADGAKYLIQQALTEDLKSLPSKPRSSESLDSELRFMFGLQWLGEAGEEVRGRRKAQGKVRSRRDLRKHFKTMQHLLSDIHVKLGSYEKAGLVPPTAPFKQLYEFLASMYKEMKRIDASLTPGATASGQTLDAGSSTADKPEHGLLPGSASTSLPSAVVSAIGAQHGNLFFRQQPGESGSSVFAGFGGRDPRRRRLTDKHGRQLIDEAYETASNMVFLLTKLRADLQVYAVENQMCALMHGNGECGAGGKRRGPPASSKELVASHRRLMTRILDNLAAGAKAVSKRRLHANAVIQRVAATASEEFRSMARKYMLVLEGLHVRYVLQMQLYRNKLEMGPVYFPPDDPYPSLLPSPQYKDTEYGDTGDEDTIHLPYRRKRINSVSSIEDDLSNEFLESSWRRTISESVQGSPRSDGLWLEKDRRNAVYHISNKRLSASIHTATLASLNEYQSIQRKIGEFSGMQGAFFFPGHVTEHVFLKDGFWTGADASVGNAL